MTIAQMRIRANLNEQIERRLESGFAKRSIELARESHLDGTPHLESLRAFTIIMKVPSEKRNAEYEVCADRTAHTVWCRCSAGARHIPCAHAGAVYLYLAAMHRATAEYASYLAFYE